MELAGIRQGIQKMTSIFDVRIGKALDLHVHITIRVMFIYDEEKQIKEFRILNNSITPETKLKIHRWLQETIVDIKVIQSLGSNVMDADRFLKVGNF